MKLGYTIIYVPSVPESIDFFSQAFGFPKKFIHESGDYGELDTGETTLAFASHGLGELNFPDGHIRASESERPLGMEVAFVSDEVSAVHAKAIQLGATELRAVEEKPWGQTVSYLRCPDGTLVEICSPMS